MALARTTLSAPITASQLTFGVTSTSNQNFPAVGAPPLTYQPIVVDDEVMFLVSCPAVNIVTVRMRGSDGTDATAHDTLASVVTSASPSDFPGLQPGMMTLRPISNPDIVTYGQASEVIAVPSESSTYVFLAPPSAGAFTFGLPSVALNGMEITFTSQSAFAHVITSPSGYFTGAANGPFSTMTFPAQVGASVQLVAQNGVWNVINASITPVTFS